MNTLNKIAENIAFAFGEQYNYTLKESIKNHVVDYRALLLRQDLENNFLSTTHLLESFCVQMEVVDSSECKEITSNKYVLRSVQPIPRTIRLKNQGNLGFTFVGSPDRYISYDYAKKETLKWRHALPFQLPTKKYYDIINDHLFILNSIKPCKVLLEGPIEDPRDIDDCNYPDRFKDDVPFNCPADIVAKITDIVKRNYVPQLLKDDAEVKIEADDRP